MSDFLYTSVSGGTQISSNQKLNFLVSSVADPNMFNRKPMVKKKQGMMEAVDDPDLSFSKIMKDVQLFGNVLSCSTLAFSIMI